MNLTFTEEQRMIRDSVSDYFTGSYDFVAHQTRIRKCCAIDVERWQQFAELGWLGLMVPAEAGGLGAGAEEAMFLMEGAGAALCIEPLLATAVMAAPVLPLARSGSVGSHALTDVIGGRASLAFAHSESHHGFAPLAVKTTAVFDGGGYVLTGHKVLVDNGGDAEWIVVPAATAGTRGGATGLSLFLVPGDAPGLTRTAVPMVDGSWSADLTFSAVKLDEAHLLGETGQGAAALTSACYRGIAASCAEALGAMNRAIEICRGYLGERKQFGKPLSAFQALRHRFVDMLLAEERARSMTILAAIRAAEGDFASDDARRDMHLAKFIVGRSAAFIGAQAIQLHGGMGMAYEYPIGHYYRKLLNCEAAFGTPDDHQALLWRLAA